MNKFYEGNKEPGYVTYAKNYDDSIHYDMGKWSGAKSSEMGITMDIINNIPMIAYNYEYKAYVSLSLLSTIMEPRLLHQAIDIVMDSFTLKSGFPLDEKDKGVIVHSKRELFDAIVRKNAKIIHVVKPKANCPVDEQAKFYHSMCEYKYEFVAKWLKRKAYEAYADFIILMNKKYKL